MNEHRESPTTHCLSHFLGEGTLEFLPLLPAEAVPGGKQGIQRDAGRADFTLGLYVLDQSLGDRLQSSLETARMATTGSYDGMKASIITVWNDEGSAIMTEITLSPLSPILHIQPIHVGQNENEPLRLPDNILVELSAEATTHLEQICRTARSLELTPEVLKVGWPAPLEDPTPLLSVLSTMAQLLQSLRSSKGPYR